jgi:predicted transposase YdaD
MRYITSHEEIGIEKGRAEGRAEGRVEGRVQALHEGLALALEMKFGPEATSLSAAIEHVTDLTTLERLVHDIRAVTSLEIARSIITSIQTMRSYPACGIVCHMSY